MKKKINIQILVLSLSLLSLVACSDKKRHPGSIYAPDMTYARAYETYTENDIFLDSMTNRIPVAGTVARGESTNPQFHAADSSSVYSLTNSIEMNEDNLKEGKRLYNIYCGICHGVNLDGNGPLYVSEKYPLAPANFTDPKFVAYSAGKIYYTILFGKNRMGSYASQLSEEQRWLVVGYIKNKQGGNSASSSTTSTSTSDSTSSK